MIEDACASTSPAAASAALKRLEAERVPVVSSTGPELGAVQNARVELPIELPVPKPEYSDTFEAALERREEAVQSAGRSKTAGTAQAGLAPKAAADKGRRASAAEVDVSDAPRVVPLLGLAGSGASAAGVGKADRGAGASASLQFDAVQHIGDGEAPAPAPPKRKLLVAVPAITGGAYSADAAPSQTPSASGIVPGFVSPSGAAKSAGRHVRSVKDLASLALLH